MPHLSRSQRIYSKTADEFSERLVDAALLMRGKEELTSFFNDLLTRTEKAMLGKRLLIALFLGQEYSYEDISRILRVGPNTISIVNDRLRDGRGFELIIKRLEKEKRVQKILETARSWFDSLPRKTGRGRWKSLYPTR